MSCRGQAQQDPQYSQYMFNQLVLNPAYAGSKDALSATTFIRSQWTNIDGAPNTQTISIHTPLKKKKIGLGFSVVADQIGPKKSVAALGSYAYNLKLKKGKLAFGLRVGVYSYTYNWTDINYKDKRDLYNTQNATTQLAPTADAGIYYYNNSMYIGFSATHLYNGRIIPTSNWNGDNAVLSPHYFFTFGKAWAFSDKFIFNPSFVLKGTKGSPTTFDINMSAMIDQKIWIGFSLRSSYGMSAYTQFKISDKFKIGYAYDFGFNKIGRVGGATHELMLGYDLNIFNSKIISPRYL